MESYLLKAAVGLSPLSPQIKILAHSEHFFDFDLFATSVFYEAIKEPVRPLVFASQDK